MRETTVVLGIDGPALLEEVLHFLDRRPGVRVVAVANDAAALEAAIRARRPAVIVATPTLARVSEVPGVSLVVVAEKETTGDLRSAIEAGASAFCLWPEEREPLVEALRAAGHRDEGEPGQGIVIAVVGVRGGAGATFLATNLAAALAPGRRAVLADLDPLGADVTAALGLPPDGETRTVADLAPVRDELSPEHVERVLVEHESGVRLMLGPPEPGPPPVSGDALAQALRRTADVAVLHLPRSLDEIVPVLGVADVGLLCLTLDVLGFRAARRLLSRLEADGLADRCRLVVNRATRGEIVPEDCERVFGRAPVAVIGFDRAVPRAQNRGELIIGRGGRAARALAALARSLVEEVAA